MISVNSQVTVRVPQLRGNLSELKRGQVVSIAADRVSVQFPGEFKAQDFAVDKVELAQDTYGQGGNVFDPYEKPVVQMFRNR